VGERNRRRSSGVRGGSKAGRLGALIATLIVVGIALSAAGCTATSSGASPTSSTSGTSSSRVTTISLSSPTYRPTAQPGTTSAVLIQRGGQAKLFGDAVLQNVLQLAPLAAVWHLLDPRSCQLRRSPSFSWRAPGEVGHRIERSQDGSHDSERRIG
jgi:hypothetical protein